VKDAGGSVVLGGRVLGDDEVILQLLNERGVRLGFFLLLLLQHSGLE